VVPTIFPESELRTTWLKLFDGWFKAEDMIEWKTLGNPERSLEQPYEKKIAVFNRLDASRTPPVDDDEPPNVFYDDKLEERRPKSLSRSLRRRKRRRKQKLMDATQPEEPQSQQNFEEQSTSED
jgi:hypothetical protein